MFLIVLQLLLLLLLLLPRRASLAGGGDAGRRLGAGVHGLVGGHELAGPAEKRAHRCGGRGVVEADARGLEAGELEGVALDRVRDPGFRLHEEAGEEDWSSLRRMPRPSACVAMAILWSALAKAGNEKITPSQQTRSQTSQKGRLRCFMRVLSARFRACGEDISITHSWGCGDRFGIRALRGLARRKCRFMHTGKIGVSVIGARQLLAFSSLDREVGKWTRRVARETEGHDREDRLEDRWSLATVGQRLASSFRTSSAIHFPPCGRGKRRPWCAGLQESQVKPTEGRGRLTGPACNSLAGPAPSFRPASRQHAPAVHQHEEDQLEGQGDCPRAGASSCPSPSGWRRTTRVDHQEGQEIAMTDLEGALELEEMMGGGEGRGTAACSGLCRFSILAMLAKSDVVGWRAGP